MCYLDPATASVAALDLSARLASAGRARIIPDDIIDHLETWEPDTLPVAVRLDGPAYTVVTASDVTPATRRLLAAYAPAPVAFRVLECADTE